MIVVMKTKMHML